MAEEPKVGGSIGQAGRKAGGAAKEFGQARENVAKRATAEEPKVGGSTRQAGRQAGVAAKELGQATEDAADRVSDEMRDGYEQMQRFGRDAAEAARRRYEDGKEIAARSVSRQPLLAMLMLASFGYLLAWLVHGRR